MSRHIHFLVRFTFEIGRILKEEIHHLLNGFKIILLILILNEYHH